MLSRVTKRTVTNLSDNTVSEETYAYDAAGNITSCTVSDGTNTFVYDQNNRLTSYNGQAVTYDMDGNMLSATLNGAQMSFVYDSANRLISAGGNTYTYNVEDVRVRNLCGESETTYAYNTNGKLSQLLVKTTDGVVTKYVYGLGLIGEETSGSFKTYHFDYRGSTTAITDINGNVTDTFAYDTYGNLISRTGTSVVIFLYNGRDGVVTDNNGLIYMRARYYSPELRRFINADIIAGEISNAVTLNRYAYANGNPVSNIDPFGLSAERGSVAYKDYINDYMQTTDNPLYLLIKALGLDISKEYKSKNIPLVDSLFGGIKANLSISVSHQINPNGKVSIEQTSNENINQSIGIDIFNNDELTISKGIYTDSERVAAGKYTNVQLDEWELSLKNQIGVYSIASILGMSYIPDSILLPTVTVALDTEISHIVTAGVVTVAVAAPYVAPALSAAISGISASASATVTTFVTTAVSFMGQLSRSAA